MIMLPLYHEVHTEPPQFRTDINYGLWFNRFYSGFSRDFKKDEGEAKKWLEQFHNRKIGLALEESLSKRALSLRLLANAQSGKAGVFKLDSLFVSGMGLSHPIENGFLWHPTLGMPYIPGSIVKGMIRSLIETAYSTKDPVERERVLLHWFGSKSKEQHGIDSDNQTGCLIFFDALPVASCQMYVDIITPHYGKWYEKGADGKGAADSLPGDWHSPVPIPYLTARDLSLQFIILPRNKVAETEMTSVWKALHKALDWIGAGAKTAIGYGRMKPDEKLETQLQNKVDVILQNQQEDEKMASLSEIGQAILLFEKKWFSGEKIISPNEKNNQVLEAIAEIVNTLIGHGSAEDKMTFFNLLSEGEKQRYFIISSKREKEYKRWKTVLRS